MFGMSIQMLQIKIKTFFLKLKKKIENKIFYAKLSN